MTRPRLVLVGIVLVAITVAWTIRFVCDDAFITFVYARNLVRGDGLTWFGDAIEGYTNFGWALWIAGGLSLGVDPVVWAWLGSLASLGFVIVGTYLLVRARDGSDEAAVGAAGLLAANFTVLAYGTSGLETMFQTALITYASVQVERLRRSAPLPRRLAILSTLVSLAIWTRLDSSVACGVLGVVTAVRLIRTRAPIACWLAAIVPAVVLVGGWLVWKLSYYGHVLPNTFTAKVGITSATLGHGVAFVGAFLWAYALWTLLIAAAVVAVQRRVTSWVSVAVVVVWLLYIVVVGGDFMEFRFFVPIMPALAAIIAEAVTSPVVSPRMPAAWLRAVAAVAVSLAASWHHAASFRGTAADNTYDSVDALGTFYGLVPDGDWNVIGDSLGSALHGTTATLACNGVGAVPYFSEIPTLDQLGLTDAWVAANGVRPPRSLRPGHQRYAPYDYLVSRKVSFVIGTATVLDNDKIASMRVMTSIPWLTRFLGPASTTATTVASIDLVVVPVATERSLVMWYLTPSDDVTRAITAAGWHRLHLGR